MGLSKRQAARLSGGLISPSGWARYEDPDKLDGEVRRDSLIGIARGLALPPAEVLGWAGLEYEPHPGDPDPLTDDSDSAQRYKLLSPSNRAAVDAVINQLLAAQGITPEDVGPR